MLPSGQRRLCSGVPEKSINQSEGKKKKEKGRKRNKKKPALLGKAARKDFLRGKQRNGERSGKLAERCEKMYPCTVWYPVALQVGM